VLGIDEGAVPPSAGLGDDLQRQRGLAGGLRPVDLDDPAARQAADAERDVEPERAGGDRLDRRDWRSPMRMTEPLPNCFSICEERSRQRTLLVVVHGDSSDSLIMGCAAGVILDP
jgi:hypothetical protein